MWRTVLAWLALAAFALVVKHWFVDRYFPTMPMNFIIWIPIAIVFWIVITVVTITFLAIKGRHTRNQ